VKKLSAICKICFHNANYTFKTTPTDSNNIIQIGGAESYIPVCRECLYEKQRQQAGFYDSEKTVESSNKRKATPTNLQNMPPKLKSAGEKGVGALTPVRNIRVFNDSTNDVNLRK